MLFISYSREDDQWANRLKSALETAGQEYWIDRQQIRTGDVWTVNIEQGIKQCTGVVVIVTLMACRTDSFVLRELRYASVLKKPIYPIVPEPVPLESMPMEVAELQQIRCEGDVESGVKELLDQLAPLQRGGCLIEVSRNLATTLTPESVEYALMSHFPLVRQIAVKEEITTGNSGSKVYLVDAAFRGGANAPAPHFLKINNAGSDTPRKRHEMAYKTNFRRHMPNLADATPFDPQYRRLGLLYGLSEARGGYASLSELLSRNLGQATMLIRQLCAALTEWNDGGRRSKPQYAHELLETALCNSQEPESRAYRLDPYNDSSVFGRSASLMNLTAETRVIDFETRRGLPNPLAYLGDGSLWQRGGADISITYPSGNIHGDLHARNVQAVYKSRDRKTLALSVIDFDTYDPENLLFFDFASLEISLLIRLFRIDQVDSSQEIRHELERLSKYLAAALDLPSEVPDLNVLSVGACVLLRPVREAAAAIADVHFEYQHAFWLARAAAALSLLRKRRATYQERTLAALVAADSINRLIKDLDLPLPEGSAQKLEWTHPEAPIQLPKSRTAVT